LDHPSCVIFSQQFSNTVTGGTIMGQIQYIADENNKITGVIVPIDNKGITFCVAYCKLGE
jgi:hypothetical protein